jgi:hypothetical protein
MKKKFEIRQTQLCDTKIEDGRFTCQVFVELTNGATHLIDVESAVPVADWGDEWEGAENLAQEHYYRGWEASKQNEKIT